MSLHTHTKSSPSLLQLEKARKQQPRSSTAIDKINKSGKTAIVMGSEGKGIRRLVEENCDSTVKLPISENVESLNVSTAAAIALYELNKD